MTAAPSSAFPAAALDWLIEPHTPQVLALGRSAVPLLPGLADRVRQVTVNDATVDGVRAMLRRAPRALPTVSDPHRLPFIPCAFDTVVLHQSFHTLRTSEALPELARVIRPGGSLALAYTVRDDSVPWVRRLVRLLRSYDPGAMAGAYGADSVAALASSPHFPAAQTRSFRLWTPISREGLAALVRRRFPDLSPDRLAALLTQVDELYAGSARAPEPLLLPYQVVCTRAQVDHSEFTSGLVLPDEGLPITL